MLALPVLWILLSQAVADNWRLDLDPAKCPNCKQFIRPGSNFTSVVAYTSSLIVGGKNALFELDFKAFVEHVHTDTDTETQDFDQCVKDSGQSPADCHNFYTVIMKISDDNLFVCGTAAFKPKCGTRFKADLSYASNEADVDYISSNPHSSMDYLRMSESNYTAFIGYERGSNTKEFAIARINMMPGSYAVKAQTDSGSNFWLNSPLFLYSFESEQYIYFVYQEIAVETSPEQVYSRIARICKDDTGDTSVFSDKKFLTFSKVQLQCSYSQQGQAPYQFDRVTGAYHTDDYLFTVFSGSNTIIETGSVFCMFKMAHIKSAFAGKYKFFSEGRWQEKLPKGAPFKCGNDPGWTYYQANLYQMMAEVVKSEQVLYYSKEQLQQLTVSTTKVEDYDYHILHSGSKTGNVVRVGFRINEFQEVKSLRSVSREAGKGEITKVVFDGSNNGDVYVIASDWITHVPLESECSQHSTCQTCQTAFPHCGWCVDSTRRASSCTLSVRCISDSWQSPFEQCAALPEFKTRPQDITVAHNEPIILECLASTDIDIQWVREGGPLPSTMIVQQDGTLYTERADASHNGCYSCQLRGASGVVSSQACVTVQIAPYFLDEPQLTMTVSQGKDVTLQCRATGSPAPVITWFKVDATLPEGSFISDEGELKIIRVIAEDEGEYKCNAKNSVSQNWSEPVYLSIISMDPEIDAREQDDNQPMVLLIVCVCVFTVIVLCGAFGTHCYCKRRQNKKFTQLQLNEALPGYNLMGTYLDPRMTPLGSLRDQNSLSSADYNRQCYSETSTPRWPPPHTMMVHNADPNNMPPPPYQHYFMEQHILGQRQAYENVAHAHNQHYLVPQPPSPTEQIPISFTSPLPKPHSEDSINSMVSEHRTSSPPNPSQYYVPYNPPSPPYHSTGYLIPSLHAPISPPLIPPPGMETHQPFQHRPCPSPPLRTTSNLQDSLLSRMNPNHVYDEIVMPQRTLPPRPPVPPRPSRSQSRSPPQSPIEEG